MTDSIGKTPTYGLFHTQTLTGNGTTKTFTLDFAVGSSASILVIKNDRTLLRGGAGFDYTVGGGKNITFATAIGNGVSYWILFLGRELSVPRSVAMEPGYQAFTGDGSTTAFTLTNGPLTSTAVLVFVDGVKKKPTTDYTVSGTTLTFGVAPSNSTKIDVHILGVEKYGLYNVEDLSITPNKLNLTSTTFSPSIAAPSGMNLTSVVTRGSYYSAGAEIKLEASLGFIPEAAVGGALSNKISLTIPVAYNAFFNPAEFHVQIDGTNYSETGHVASTGANNVIDIYRRERANFTNSQWTVYISGKYRKAS